MNDTDTRPTVTEIRTALIRDTSDYYQRRQAHYRTMRETQTKTGTAYDTALDAYEGLVAAGCFAEALATVLRIVEERHPETAADLASLVHEVQENGNDCLDGANDDIWALIERERTAELDEADAEIAAADSELPPRDE